MPGTAQPAVQLPRIQCPYTASSCPLFNPIFSASDVLGTSAGVRERAKPPPPPPPSASAPFDPTPRDYLAQHALPAALPSPSLGFADSMRAAQALSPVHHRSSGDSAASTSTAGPHAPAYSDYPIAPSPELSGTTGGGGRTVSGGSASPPTPGPSYKASMAAYGGEPVSPKTLPLVLSPALAGLPFAGRLPSIDLLDGASSSLRRPPLPPSPRVAYPSSLAATAAATSTSTSITAPTFSPPERYTYDRARLPSGSSGSPTSDAYLAQVTPVTATSPGLGLLCAASAVAFDYGGVPGMGIGLGMGTRGAQQQVQQQPGPGLAPPSSLAMPSEWRPAPQRRARDAAGAGQWEGRIEEIEDDAEDEGEGERAAGRGCGRSGSGSGSSAGAGAGPSAPAQGFAPPLAPKVYAARAPEQGAAADEGGPPAQVQEVNATATPFITKLQHVLVNPAHHDVIRWNTDGSCVVYQHSSSRLLEILGKYFRHTSVMSLARQLNIYGFRRLSVGEMLRELERLPLPPPPPPSSSTSTSSAAAAAPPPPPIMSASEWSGFTHPSFWRDEPGRAVCDLSVLKPQGPKTEKGRANLAKKMAAGEGNKKRKKSGSGKVGGVRKGGLDLE